MGTRIIGLLAACFLLASTAAGAAAADGIQLGPTLLFPTLTVSATHDDNIHKTSDHEKSDWITSVAPSLKLTMPVRRFYLEAEGGLDFLSYSDDTENDATDWFIGAAVGADFPGGLDFKLSDQLAERRLVSTQEFGPGEDTTVNTLKAEAGYAIRDALRLQLSWLRDSYEFGRSQSRERVENTVQGSVFWKFLPRTSAVVDVAFSDYAYEERTTQDGTATQLDAGVTWDVTARSTGYAKAGWQWKRYDHERESAGIEDGNYFVFAVGARHTFTQRTRAELEFSRGSRESDFVDNPYYLRTELKAAAEQRFTPKLYGRVAVRYSFDDYPHRTSFINPFDPLNRFESGMRTDQTTGGDVVLGFDVTRWLALEAGYSGERRTSSFDTFEYQVNRVTLSAKAAF